jgi:hypothetical protein
MLQRKPVRLGCFVISDFTEISLVLQVATIFAVVDDSVIDIVY